MAFEYPSNCSELSALSTFTNVERSLRPRAKKPDGVFVAPVIDEVHRIGARGCVILNCGEAVAHEGQRVVHGDYNRDPAPPLHRASAIAAGRLARARRRFEWGRIRLRLCPQRPAGRGDRSEQIWGFLAIDIARVVALPALSNFGHEARRDIAREHPARTKRVSGSGSSHACRRARADWATTGRVRRCESPVPVRRAARGPRQGVLCTGRGSAGTANGARARARGESAQFSRHSARQPQGQDRLAVTGVARVSEREIHERSFIVLAVELDRRLESRVRMIPQQAERRTRCEQ